MVQMTNLPSLLVGIALVVFAGATPVTKDDPAIAKAATEVRGVPKDYRLPSDIVPVSYKILLEPHLEGNFIFDGVVKIQINVENATDKIVLHANDSLTIISAKLFSHDGIDIHRLPLKEIDRNKTNDFLTLHSPTTLIVGAYILELEFKGKLNDDLKGFYRSHYEDADGETRWLATTQFEPTYARLAFPCWDEPHLKAKFDISIKHPKALTAISNMHEIGWISGSRTDFGKYTTTFATTPIMSTYLVAFVVSDFALISSADGSFNIWARPNAILYGEFALDRGEKELKALDKYTGLPHASNGFKKMDSVAIPQFAANAMENWGLVTYREVSLLVGDDELHQVRVATIISHELAHQWFGNLVSPKWWKWVWLSEGFSNYLEYVITAEVCLSCRLKDLQVIKDLQNYAFQSDSVSTAVDMNYDVNSPKEIEAKFNDISYHKAGSVVRMIAHVLGEPKFKIALQKYLSTMKFKSATSDDLFAELVKEFPPLPGVTAKPLDILNNWANTPGFPTIKVTRNYPDQTVNITQERYLYKPDDAHKETYFVPINFAKEQTDFNDTTVTSWLEKDKTVNNLNVGVAADNWIIFNKQHFGYYRVNYDEANWKLISEFLKNKNHTDIHVLNRGQLVDDGLNLARNGKLKYSIALDLMQFLKKDFDYVPWYSALSAFSYLQRTLPTITYHVKFEDYLRKLIEPVLEDVTFDDSTTDDHLRRLLRVLIIEKACALGVKSCRETATLKVQSWWFAPRFSNIASYLLPVVLCAGVRDIDTETWDKLYAMYSESQTRSLQAALGCSSNADILKEYLTKAIDKSVDGAPRDGIFNTVITNSAAGVNVALDFVLANADAIYAVSGNNTDSLKKYITAIGYRLTTNAQLDKLKAAVNEHVTKVFAEACNAAQENLNWIEANEPQFTEYFKETAEGED